jgi:hypothetical protein
MIVASRRKTLYWALVDSNLAMNTWRYTTEGLFCLVAVAVVMAEVILCSLTGAAAIAGLLSKVMMSEEGDQCRLLCCTNV